MPGVRNQLQDAGWLVITFTAEDLAPALADGDPGQAGARRRDPLR